MKIFKHFCDNCMLLSNIDGLDVYFCPQKERDYHTFVIRYGNDPGEQYASHVWLEELRLDPSSAHRTSPIEKHPHAVYAAKAYQIAKRRQLF